MKYTKKQEKAKDQEGSSAMNSVITDNDVKSAIDGTLPTDKNQLQTVILSGIRFTGDIEGSHDLYLNGEFEGKINISAMVFVGQAGRLVGEVNAENVIVEGEVDGMLTAKERVVIHDGGRCKGDIFAPSVMISDKAFFQGQIKMGEVPNDSQANVFTEKRKSVLSKGSYSVDFSVPVDEDKAQKDEKSEKTPKITVVNETKILEPKAEKSLDKAKKD